jgi:hypothetical protein
MACVVINAYCLYKKHNAENVSLKAHPAGPCPIVSLCVIAIYHAMSILAKQCLDSDFWARAELMIIKPMRPRLN